MSNPFTNNKAGLSLYPVLADQLEQWLSGLSTAQQKWLRDAGFNAKANWFERHAEETEKFPPLLVKEDWKNEKDYELCQRYLNRQSPRLLMLQGLSKEDRQRMELAARVHSLEVAKYYPLYPDVSDKKIMNSIRVEAQLRQSKGEKVHDIKY